MVVETFLESGDATVNVPMKVYGASDECGCLKFETYHETEANVSDSVDKNHPHVKVGCMVCKDTHQNPQGTPYACNYCVCVKCTGTGIKNKDKSPCT